MKTGDKVQACARKTDGTIYRSWHATIESMDADLIVTVAPAGSLVNHKEGRQSAIAYHLRSYYWSDKFYNLIEAFEPNGKLVELYINIAAPPTFENDILSFKDHELDVVVNFPGEARIIDEDEFLEAVETYNYTKEFQEQMYAAAKEALDLANHWVAKPVPEFEKKHK
jgi:protein associated with RNAse G/E